MSCTLSANPKKVTQISSNTAVKYLKRENGLPSGQIQGLTQDSAGRLWLATPSGLASFDGSRIRSYTQNDGLKTHGLRAIALAQDDRVWVGSDVGYDIVEGGLIKASSHDDDNWSFGFVECIHCTENTVWLGTASGLVVHDGMRFSLAGHAKLHSTMITAINSGPDGAVWVATANGDLLFHADDQWQEPTKPEWQQVGRILCIARGPGNHILLGGENGFLEIAKSGDVIARQQDQENSDSVSAMLFARGELWVGTSKQLRVYRRHAGDWRYLETLLEGRLINAVHIDGFGNAWLATESHGVAKISALNRSIIRIRLGDEQAIFSLRPGRHSGEIIAAGDRASWLIQIDRANKASEISALTDCQVWDIQPLDDGALLAATAGGLIHISSDGVRSILGATDAVLSRPNRCLIAHQGQTYVGTLGGCAIVQPDLAVVSIPHRDHDPLGYVYTLAKSHDGRLWAGTLGNGLWLLEQNEFRRFEHELLSKTGNTYSIDGREDGLITFVQDNKIFLLRKNDDLIQLAECDDPIAGWTVRWAPDGSIWTGSASGLTQYNSEDGRRVRQIVALLGLSNWEFTTSRSLHISDDGSFYCGVNSGLLCVDTKGIEKTTETPSVKFGRATWQQTTPVQSGNSSIVTFGRWTVDIEVFSAWFIDEDDLQFRFRLLGFDQDWRELSQLASVRFNSLPPGNYKLEAQAYNRMVGYGPIATVIKIRVLTPRWANRIFMAPFAAAGQMWRIAEALFRNRSLIEKNVELERKVRARTADIEQAKLLLETANRELASQSLTDALTGIGNRRQFDDRFDAALKDAAITGKPLSLILIDVDRFKPYNDIYGHAKGDDCLSFVARKLEATLYRPADMVARYGGEEFAVILPDVAVGGAMSLAERLRRGIETLAMEHKGAPETQQLTISVGVTTLEAPAGMDVQDDTATRIIECADAALYDAKENGRNQCVFRDAPHFDR